MNNRSIPSTHAKRKLPIFLITTLLLHISLLALTDKQNYGESNTLALRGLEEPFPVVLLWCVSFWFWWKKGFDLQTHVLVRVHYSCGGVLAIWFWREIVFGVTHILSVQHSCAVVSVFWL